MKKSLKLVFFSVIMIVAFIMPTMPIAVFAESNEILSSLETFEIPEEKKNTLIEDLDLREIEFNDINDFENNTIITFDVSINEKIAIGLNNYTILICDKNMNIEKALRFNKNATEDCYYLGWNGDTLFLLMNRRSHIYQISLEGEIIDINDYSYMNLDNSELLHEIYHRESTVVNGVKYEIEKTTWTMKYLGGDKYDLLFRENENGEREELFVSKTKQPTGNIVLVLIFIASGVAFTTTVAVAFIVYRIIMKKHRGTNTGDSSTS